MLLALDTSTAASSIALYDERGVLAELTWHTHENHTRSLLPEIVRLMELVDSNAQQVRAIGVATGPGSFTGLRIGLSAAKGLAFSLNAALIGVPTLDITAHAHADSALPVCAILQAGRGRYAAALYEKANNMMQRMSDYFFASTEAFAAELEKSARARSGKILAAGEADQNLRAVLARELPEKIVFVSEGLNVRRAGVLGACAWTRWQAGRADDLQTLAPYYIPTASLA